MFEDLCEELIQIDKSSNAAKYEFINGWENINSAAEFVVGEANRQIAFRLGVNFYLKKDRETECLSIKVDYIEPSDLSTISLSILSRIPNTFQWLVPFFGTTLQMIEFQNGKFVHVEAFGPEERLVKTVLGEQELKELTKSICSQAIRRFASDVVARPAV